MCFQHRSEINKRVDITTRSIRKIKDDPIQLHKERRRAEITSSLLHPQRNDTILDIGCGDGYQMSYFANQVSQIVGVDMSKSMLKEAKAYVQEADFVCANATSLPFRPRIFRKVLSLELLEHLSEPSKVLGEIDMCLQVDGILVVSVPYKEQIIWVQCIHCGKPTPHYGHIQNFDEAKIAQDLPSNYRLLKREYVCNPMSSYILLAFLPTKLWKFVDAFTRRMPGMKPGWLIEKVQKNDEK